MSIPTFFPENTKIPNMKWLHPPQSVMKGQAPHLSSDICAAMTVTTACLRALQNRSSRTLCDSMPTQKLPEHGNYKTPKPNRLSTQSLKLQAYNSPSFNLHHPHHPASTCSTIFNPTASPNLAFFSLCIRPKAAKPSICSSETGPVSFSARRSILQSTSHPDDESVHDSIFQTRTGIIST